MRLMFSRQRREEGRYALLHAFPGSEKPESFRPLAAWGTLPETEPNLYTPCLMNVIACFIVSHSVQKFSSKGNFRGKKSHLCNKEEIVRVPGEAQKRKLMVPQKGTRCMNVFVRMLTMKKGLNEALLLGLKNISSKNF